jgi:hypothetical protein
VFTARYALSPYIKQIRFVFKGLKQSYMSSGFHGDKNCVNSSRSDNRVNCLKTSDVSETHSVSILRESTECVSETSEDFKQLTRISAREKFIQ